MPITTEFANGHAPLFAGDDDTLTWVRVVRLARGMALRDLADAAGTDVATLSRVEPGRGYPRRTTRRCLAAALDVPEAMPFGVGAQAKACT